MYKKFYLLIVLMFVLINISISQEHKETRWDRLVTEVKNEVGDDEIELERRMGEIKKYEITNGVRILSSIDWQTHLSDEVKLNNEIAVSKSDSEIENLKKDLQDLKNSEVSYSQFKTKSIKK